MADISSVTLGPGALQAVKTFLADNGISQPVRIDIAFKGCCDASLCLAISRQQEGDIAEFINGVTFVISAETYGITGDVNISCADEKDKLAFVLTSGKPISEWEGFAPCEIKI